MYVRFTAEVKMKIRMMQYTILIMTALILSACGGNIPAPTEDVNVVMTAAINTMVASFFMT